jgi:GAF domain-containing protein
VREIVEIAPDVTALYEAQQALLQERDRAAQERVKLLSTVAKVANQLLRWADYTTALPDVLRILGRSAFADLCRLVQNVTDSNFGKPAVRLHTEWCRSGIQASIAHTPTLESALLWEYFPDFQDKLAQGEIISFLVNDLSEPARCILVEQGNTSMTMVPIRVQGQFWGVFGFDYCGEPRLSDRADKAIFAIAVDSIAPVIERQQQDAALRESEERYRTLFELSSEGIF